MKKPSQQKLNKILTGAVVVLALYSVLFTWLSVNTYFDIKRSLDFLYMNVNFEDPAE